MNLKLPNFLIVGAAKSGTSSLHNYLNQHNDIFLPSYTENGLKVKEPRFFIKDLVKNRLHSGVWDWNEYKSLFKSSNDFKAVGESTVLYLYYYEHAINNIKQYLGSDVKIIIMLRNPVDRAYSAYVHVSRGLKESFSFEESLILEKDRLEHDQKLTPMVMYQDMGLYYKMVNYYINEFENIHIIFYDDFKDNTELELKKTFDFLEVCPNQKIDFSVKHNVGGLQWKNNFVKKIFMRDNLLRRTSKRIFNSNLRKNTRKNLENFFKKKVDNMNEETRAKLSEYYKDDVMKLGNLLKKDLSKWIEN